MDKDAFPFMIGKTVSGTLFVDRADMRKHLATNFRSGVGTVLASP